MLTTPNKACFVFLLLSAICQAGYSQDAKVYSSSTTKIGNVRVVNLINNIDTVKITEEFMSSSVSDRGITTSDNALKIVWNKEKKKNELYYGSDEFLGETGTNQKDFFNFTPATGKPLAMIKIAKNEWRYTCAGQELIKIKKIDKKTVEITVLDQTQAESDLALLMSYAYASYLVDEGGINPMLIVTMILLAIMRSAV